MPPEFDFLTNVCLYFDAFFSAAAVLRETGCPLPVPPFGARVRGSTGDAGAGGSLDTVAATAANEGTGETP